MSQLLLFHCTHDRTDHERVTVPFVAANVAVASGQPAAVVCTADAVWLGTPDGAEGIEIEGQSPLEELIDGFVAGGGEVWLCSACTTPRGIGEDDCREGAVIVGAARIVAEIADGASSITLT